MNSMVCMDNKCKAEAYKDLQNKQHLVINGKEQPDPPRIVALQVKNGQVYLNGSWEPFVPDASPN